MTGEFEAEILSQEGVASVEVRKLEGASMTTTCDFMATLRATLM